MIRIRTQPHYRAAKSWLFEVVFRERLNTHFEVEWASDATHFSIENAENGHTLLLADVFFAQIAENSAPAIWPLPQMPFEVNSPFAAGEKLTVLYGKNAFVHRGEVWEAGFDLFGSAFFMLTRWEEAAGKQRDRHGRFPADAAVAVRFGFLNRPVVDEYVAFLRRCLHLPENSGQKFSIHFSCDVDHPRLWRTPQGRLRTLAGETLRGGFPALKWWMNHLESDPFDVFGEWLDLLERHNLRGHFNFLGKRPRSADAWYDLGHPAVTTTLQLLESRGHTIGFHASYEGLNDLDAFVRERDGLQAQVGQLVRTGRQHYLRFSSPDTWRVWADAGMEWDSTLGYPEAPGFRAGTCLPYRVFDFERMETLNLHEKPLVLMDVTLALAQGLTPEAGRETLYDLARRVQKHRGEMVLLWHNSSWNTYFWAPWQPIVREFLEDFA